MEILKLMNSNPNWRDVLSTDPYNITIKEDGEFVLLKYSQIDSDFNLQILFGMYNGKYKNIKEYLYSQRPEQILKLIESLFNTKKIETF